MAIGKVFQYSVKISDLKIYFGKGTHRIKLDAEALDQDRVPLEEISGILREDEVQVEIILGNGHYSEKVWGCDLTEEYININAHYTT